MEHTGGWSAEMVDIYTRTAYIDPVPRLSNRP